LTKFQSNSSFHGTPAGEVIERTFSAADEAALRADLSQQGYYLFGITRGAGLSGFTFRKPRVAPSLVLIFAQELAEWDRRLRISIRRVGGNHAVGLQDLQADRQVRTECQSETLIVRISDQGPGLTPQQRDSLFDQRATPDERNAPALNRQLAFVHWQIAIANQLLTKQYGGRQHSRF
jgi:hypothetical protein